jgi:peptidyl-dipeptidase Dcp
MKKILLLAATSLALCTSCTDKKEKVSTNPIMQEYDTPFQIPPFEKITVNDMREAFMKGIDAQKAEIQAIIDNKEDPNFENTIAALDNSGKLLEKAEYVFDPLSNSDSNEDLQKLETEVTPLLSALNDEIYLNQDLFVKVKKVYENQVSMNLNEEQTRVLELIYKQFVRGGANLSLEDRDKLSKLNNEISMLQVKFEQNLLHETNQTFVIVNKVEDLEGLPESNIQAAAKMASENGQEGKWMFNMQRQSCNPVLQYCKNREVRKKVYEAYYNRGNQDNEYNNKEISKRLLELRMEKAKLMGYPNYAAFSLDNKMAKTPENVYKLLDQIWKPAVEKAKQELDDIRAEIKKEGQNFEPEAWDFRYYQDKAKIAKYSVDENEVKNYLEINNVREGIFYVAKRLYGLTFKERTKEFPSFNNTAKAFEVDDKDGTPLAIFYADYMPRAGKRAGAWCTSFREQSYNTKGERVIPLVENVCSMTLPSSDKPALQTIDNITTMFHEFGHALHSFMRDVHYSTVGHVERDFVEMPSQFNEHWALEPEVLNVYAKHYQTGEIIPKELVDKIVTGSKYGQGFATVEYLAASLVDMDMHVLTEIPADFDVMKFEEEKLKERGIPRQILPRYRVTNFSHTMGGGYTAGYYSYIWAEVYEADAFRAYKEVDNIFDTGIADRMRKYIFEKGGIKDGISLYRDFRGHDPKIDGLLENRGLK